MTADTRHRLTVLKYGSRVKKSTYLELNDGERLRPLRPAARASLVVRNALHRVLLHGTRPRRVGPPDALVAGLFLEIK